MKCFPLPVVVNTRPGEHRPLVIKLPIQTTHAHWNISSDCFNAQANTISLHAHAQVGIVLNIIWFPRFEDLSGVLINQIWAALHLIVIFQALTFFIFEIVLLKKLSQA